jgi:predicted nucleic acid-binding protein
MTGCVLDTDVVIAALDRSDAHHRQAAKLMRALIHAGAPRLLSLINYAEALVRPAETEASMRTAIAAMEALDIELTPPTTTISRDAARLRANHNISLADGFAIATARARQTSLATFDKRVRRALRPAGIDLAPQLR